MFYNALRPASLSLIARAAFLLAGAAKYRDHTPHVHNSQACTCRRLLVLSRALDLISNE